jgi:hypothetical protein
MQTFLYTGGCSVGTQHREAFLLLFLVAAFLFTFNEILILAKLLLNREP